VNQVAAPSDLASLPKAELHVHLEGTVRPSTMEEFLGRSSLPVSRVYSDLASFVDLYGRVWAMMTTPGDYARMVREYCEDAVRAGIRYAEMHVTTGARPFPCLAEAVEAASKERDVVLRFIVDVPRTFPIEVGFALLEGAKGASEVIGIGLGGVEQGYPPEPFAPLFNEARSRGLRSMPHAGEDAGPESIRGALDALKAERIMHGVRAVDDPRLLAELSERNIPLAVCPTSNVILGVAASLEAHPLRELWDAGITVSVNTDDPGYFDCDLVGEYVIAGRLLDLDREGYGRLALNSVETSFAPEELKEEMRRGIADWVQRQ
jgi:adenosine deaminase